jgi:hypothetical protein
MALKVVGAGIGRTGTHSLQLALQRLLGGPCYHMIEVFGHPEHIPLWQEAAEGRMPDWEKLFDGYVAGVDWPVSAYWPELSDYYPDALVLLSTRDADSWWESASTTIFRVGELEAWGNPAMLAQMNMARAMFASRFTPNWLDEQAAKRAFEAHNASVRAAVPSERLVDWHPRDGWKPICDALGLAVPEEPFPHVNTGDEFRALLRGPSPPSP